MGILGFIGGLGSASSQARQQSRDAQLQQLQMQEQQEQLKQQLAEDPLRMALLKQQIATANKQLLKMPDGSYQVIDLANPSQPGVKIGQSADYAGELRAMKQAAPAPLRDLVQAAIDSNDPAFQKKIIDGLPGQIATLAARKPTELEQFEANPAGFTAMKQAGRTPTPTEPKSPFQLWMTDPAGYARWLAANPSKTAGQATTVNDINTALDQMQSMLPKLRTKPGMLSSSASELTGKARAWAGYPDESAFQEAAASLADMIPKALSGRANQSSINNALRYMVPAFNDTQASAQRKIDNLRQLFIRYGVLPPRGSAATPPDISKMTSSVGTPVYGPDGRVIGFTK